MFALVPIILMYTFILVSYRHLVGRFHVEGDTKGNKIRSVETLIVAYRLSLTGLS